MTSDKVLANRFTVVDGVTDSTRYEAMPADGSHPWDPDRERPLMPGETFARLSGGGHPIQYHRVWTSPANLEEV